jgi:hypothetical protein
MSNTVRELDDLLTLFADNNSNQITAQDIRDFIVTTDAWRFGGNYQDLYNLPTLGTLSSQNSTDVNISGGTLNGLNNVQTLQLSVTGLLNTGVNLSANAFSTAKISIRSAIVDLTKIGETNIFTVPANYMFLIDSMEILTTMIAGTNTTLQTRFGNNFNSSEYYASNIIKNNSVGERHIIEIAQNAALSGSIVNFGVTTPSSAPMHEGAGIINGTLIKTN